MPKTTVVFYKDDDGSIPVREWLLALKDANKDAFAICAAVIEDLKEFGHELRRPTADILRDGIHELRAKDNHIQFRILYFFNGKDFAVVAHALIKRGAAVPEADIKRAVKRKKKFEADPKTHTWEENDDA